MKYPFPNVLYPREMSESKLVFIEECKAKILSGVLAILMMLVFVPRPASGEGYVLPMTRSLISTKARGSDERGAAPFPTSPTVKGENISKIGLSAIYLPDSTEGDDGIGAEAYLRYYQTPDLSLNFKVGHIRGLGGNWFDISMTPIELTGLYHVAISPESQFYFGGGFGIYFFTVEESFLGVGVEMSRPIGYHFLVGMEKQINEKTSIFCEIRDLHLSPEMHLTGGASLPVLGANYRLHDWYEASEIVKEDFGGNVIVIGIMWVF
jgi:outer membrane protein W